MQIIKFTFAFAIFISSFAVCAHLSELTCSKEGTFIVFVNGVDVNDKKFEGFRDLANEFARGIDKTKTDPKNLNFIALHNSSANILIDAGETYFEFLKSMGIKKPEFDERFLEILMATYIGNYSTLNHFNDLEFFVKKSLEILVNSHQRITDEDIAKIYKEASSRLYQDKRVIFITHSGGAIIADRVRDRILKNDGEYYNFSSHIALARPFRTYHKQVLNYSFDSDPVLGLLRLVSPDVPASNVRLIGDCPGSYWRFDFFKNHDFRCYVGEVFAQLGSSVENSSSLIRSLIYKQASEFKNNDENCCNKAEGRVWINPDNSFGGFIANTVEIETDLGEITNSQICGHGYIKAPPLSINIKNLKLFGDIKTPSPSISIKNSKLFGDIKIVGQTEIEETTLDGSIDVTGKFKSIKSEFFQDSNVTGENLSFINSKILGTVNSSSFGILSTNELNSTEVLKNGYIDFSGIISNSKIYGELVTEKHVIFDQLSIHENTRVSVADGVEHRIRGASFSDGEIILSGDTYIEEGILKGDMNIKKSMIVDSTIDSRNGNADLHDVELEKSTLVSLAEINSVGTVLISVDSELRLFGNISSDSFTARSSTFEGEINTESGGRFFLEKSTFQGMIELKSNSEFGIYNSSHEGVITVSSPLCMSSLSFINKKGSLNIDGCVNFSNLDLEGSSTIKGDVGIMASQTRFKVVNLNLNTSPSIRSFIQVLKDLVNFSGTGVITLAAYVGSNVRVLGGVHSTGFSIGDGTQIFGPVSLNCNVSGIIYQNHQCK